MASTDKIFLGSKKEFMASNNERFSLRERMKSISYAFEGILTFFRQEHNAIIHLLATMLVIGLSLFLKVSAGDAIALTLAIGLVWMAELLNTAIEKIMDFISPERNQQIKWIKDMSAAAVLVACITAVITGCLVFIPKL